MIENKETPLKNNKRRTVLFALAGLILLLISGAVFYAVILPKLKSEKARQLAWEKYVKEGWEKERSLVYFDLPLYSSKKIPILSYAAIIKEIDLDKKELKTDVVVKASNPSPQNKELLPQELTYQEFIFRIAENTILEGTEKWENLKPEQNVVLESSGDIFGQNDNAMVLKKVKVYQP